MAHDPNSDLSRALAALSIAQLWRAAGLRTDPPKRDGLVESPFRDDKSPSFSVFSQGRAFKDHASGEKGGLWKFAQLAWPNLPPRELADKLIELSGVPRTVASAPRADSVDPRQAALASAPKELRPALRAAFKRKDERAAEQRIYTEREAALRPRVEVRRVPAWPACVEQRYYTGVDALREDPKLLEEIAEDRGWPVRWAEAVLDDERLSFPVVPWHEPGQRYSKRGKAFLVQCPESVDEDTQSLRLRPVGYHQRFFMAASGNAPARKSWVYVPYVPRHREGGGGENDFSRHLREVAAERGVEAGTAMVPALPFVLSDHAAAIGPVRLVVLTEGQWDAISLAGACGWLDERCWPEGVAVFGLRGNEGMDTFLAYYGYWLTACQPVAWVLADNDTAGEKWLDTAAAAPGCPKPPTLAEKLQHLGCRRVMLSVLRKDGGRGKDFNDLWRQKRPTPEAMRAWMAKLGLPDLAAGVAAK